MLDILYGIGTALNIVIYLDNYRGKFLLNRRFALRALLAGALTYPNSTTVTIRNWLLQVVEFALV